MKEYTNPYDELEQPDSLKQVVPNKEIYGHKPMLFCPDEDCPDKTRRLFIKKRTSFAGITYFFSHYPCKISPDCTFDHSFNPETLLHKEAILWFKNIDEFKVKEHSYKTHVLKTQTIKIDPSKTITE